MPVAFAKMSSSTPGQLIASAVAIGIPEDPSLPGLIMEHHGPGSREEVIAQVREMAVQGMSHRKRPIADILSIGIEHQVQRHGATFAGVVLWNEAGPKTP